MLLAGSLVIHKHNVCARNEFVHARTLEKVRVFVLVVTHTQALTLHLHTLLAHNVHGLLHQLDAKRRAATQQRYLQCNISDAAAKV